MGLLITLNLLGNPLILALMCFPSMLDWSDPKLIQSKGDLGTGVSDVCGNGEWIRYVSRHIP